MLASFLIMLRDNRIEVSNQHPMAFGSNGEVGLQGT